MFCLDPAVFGLSGSVVEIVGNVLSDPALPQIISIVQEIEGLNTGQPSASNPTGAGVGLSDFILPLKGYVFVKQHPVVTALIGVSVLALPFAVGYAVARR